MLRASVKLLCWMMMACVVAGETSGARASGPADGDLMQWRAARARQLSSPDGWLTLVGLEWLKPGRNTVGLAADNQIPVEGPCARSSWRD